MFAYRLHDGGKFASEVTIDGYVVPGDYLDDNVGSVVTLPGWHQGPRGSIDGCEPTIVDVVDIRPMCEGCTYMSARYMVDDARTSGGVTFGKYLACEGCVHAALSHDQSHAREIRTSDVVAAINAAAHAMVA
jgi:hypothetical protein